MGKRLESAIRFAKSGLALDLGGAEDCLLVAGMGRSGTTWLGSLLQHATGYRSLFEPFFPEVVREAAPAGYFPFLPRDAPDKGLELFASRVLSGRIRNRWVDRERNPWISRGRIIKDIRLNFLLGWMKERFPKLPVIIIVRHPVDLYASWRRLRWFNLNPQSHFALPHLLYDIPFRTAFPDVMNYWCAHFLGNNDFLKFLYEWYLSQAIPLKMFDQSEYLLVSYEEVRADPGNWVNRILDYAGHSGPRRNPDPIAGRASSTDFAGGRYVNEAVDPRTLGRLRESGNFEKGDRMLKDLCNHGLEEFLANPAEVFRSHQADSMRLGTPQEPTSRYDS